MEKDFSTVSPSAVSLLLLKSLSDIPYARAAAEYIFGADAVHRFGQNIHNYKTGVARLFHFENRYKTVDEALINTGISNIIEIASGYSFRGLDMCSTGNIEYVDTDLPGIINTKNGVIAQLANPLPAGYSTVALNVLNKTAFFHIAKQLPAGPVAILNEGLLVYLNEDEKKELCTVVHSILKARGGCWITGDIYIKNNAKVELDERTRQFFEAHKVEENKFESFEAAEKFFNDNGFGITRKTIHAEKELSAWNYVSAGEKIHLLQSHAGHTRETWVLTTI